MEPSPCIHPAPHVNRGSLRSALASTQSLKVSAVFAHKWQHAASDWHIWRADTDRNVWWRWQYECWRIFGKGEEWQAQQNHGAGHGKRQTSIFYCSGVEVMALNESEQDRKMQNFLEYFYAARLTLTSNNNNNNSLQSLAVLGSESVIFSRRSGGTRTLIRPWSYSPVCGWRKYAEEEKEEEVEIMTRLITVRLDDWRRRDHCQTMSPPPVGKAALQNVSNSERSLNDFDNVDLAATPESHNQSPGYC